MAVKSDLAISELGKFGDRFVQLRSQPRALVDELRKDPEFAVAVARADTVVHLRGWFTPRKGWQVIPQRSGPLAGAALGIEWSYEGVHDTDGGFNGLPPTGRPVVVRGFTLIDAAGDKLALRRYVDWAGVFSQVGLSLNWRVPVSNGPRADGPAA
jgi:hypothetical protein